MPFGDAIGNAKIGAFGDGGGVRQHTAGGTACATGTSTQRCVKLYWPETFTALDRLKGYTPQSYMGSLLERKRDATGTEFKRNRVYDPKTGRFTQEDPIGLAGGLNLYGFANGDPVNFSDPFGLCPQWLTGRPCSGRVDLGASFIPFLSTGVDAATLTTGRNPLTGENVGLLGRGIALAGLATPASGGQIRGLISGAKHVLSEGLLRITSEFSDRALLRTYRGAINELNRHKEILAKASPEQVRSITEDIVKHEKRLQAAVEEMQRRRLSPR